MTAQSPLLAALFGVVEGLTEFLPVSSTGHLLILGHFLDFQSPERVFEVAIQMGAILALLVFYFAKIVDVLKRAPHDPSAQRFIVAVLVAFLPAALVGVMAHGFIKTVLYESPLAIAVALILGGVVLLFVDRMKIVERHADAMQVPVKTGFLIGLFQCLALVPGVSRSGATIVGSLLLGLSKRAAAEFSFFLSIPTMAGAVTYDIWKSRDALDGAAMTDIAIGFVTSFIVGLAVVKWLLDYVSRNGYALFGWWRIAVGVAVIVAVSLGF